MASSADWRAVRGKVGRGTLGLAGARVGGGESGARKDREMLIVSGGKQDVKREQTVRQKRLWSAVNVFGALSGKNLFGARRHISARLMTSLTMSSLIMTHVLNYTMGVKHTNN